MMITLFTNWLGKNPIPGFFLLTFVLAWSLWLPLGILAPENYVLSLPGAWAPTVSAVILTHLTDGHDGLRRFLKKVLHWRVGFQWYLVVLFGIAAIAYLSLTVSTMLGFPALDVSLPYGLPRAALIGFLPVFFLINILVGGPIAEDIGWRGYILPKLREKTTALNASLLIGVVWAIWHLPYFFFPAWRSVVGNTPFLWFALLTTSWSVLFAWVYVNTESILMPILFHAAINTTLGTFGVLGQSSGDVIPLMLNTLFTWLAVGMVVLIFGRDLIRSRLSAAQMENLVP